MVTKIEHKGKLLAYIISKEHFENGIEFFGSDKDHMQVGAIRREKGYIIKPHEHLLNPKIIDTCSECLIVKTGKVKVNFYVKKELLTTKIIKENDILVLLDCGHGFEFLEESVLIEVKQGPYQGLKDKMRFDENTS